MALNDKPPRRSSAATLLVLLGVLAGQHGTLSAEDRAGNRASPPQVPARSVAPGGCPPGQVGYRDGSGGGVKCVPAPATAQCPPGQVAYRDGSGGGVKCVPAPATAQCPPGQVAYRDGSGGGVRCVPAPPCAPGQSRDLQSGACQCPPGRKPYRSGGGGAGCA